MVRLDNLRPYTEYEFSVMLTKGSKSSQYSLSIRNTTQEDGRFDTYLYCFFIVLMEALLTVRESKTIVQIFLKMHIHRLL